MKTVKSLTICLLILLVSTAMIDGTQTNTVITKDLASVDKQDGIYIFIGCKPMAPVTLIGTVETGTMWNGRFPEIMSQLKKACAKKYPNAEAMEVLTSSGLEKANVYIYK